MPQPASSKVATTFYAPQVRLVNPSGKTLLSTTATDVSSVKVTLVHNDCSQATITLNNQRHGRSGVEPIFPPWKYNDLTVFKFGQRFRIDVSYRGGDKEESWATLMHARVTSIGFSFPSDASALMTLEAEDLLSLLKTNDEKDKRYVDDDEVAIVESVLKRSGCGLKLAKPGIERPDLSGEKLHQVMHQKSTTYLKMIQDLAGRLDFEVFVDNDVKKPSDVQVHFEPARSLGFVPQIGADGKQVTIVDLEWGKNLIQFTPKLKVWEQYTKVKAKGSHPGRREESKGEAGPEEIEKDLRKEGTDKPLHAVAVRQKYFVAEQGSATKNEGSVNAANLDPKRVKLLAASELRKRARELLTAECSTIGFPALRPGLHVRIRGMRAPFDGLYYVTRTVHSLDDQGYRTAVSLRRPGMLDPGDYLADSKGKT